MNLFTSSSSDGLGAEPLAFLLRPKTLSEFFGQQEIVGEGRALRQLIEKDQLHSVIFYGPPGVGKTTLASIVAHETSSEFESVSAVTSGVPELRKVAERAKERKKMGTKTVLFVDEIHRFSKSQQDALLPHVEDGTVVLIGATTENPSFEVISALLSRSQTFVFKALTEADLKAILNRALVKVHELFGRQVELQEESQDYLVQFSNGDARALLNQLEVVLKLIPDSKIHLKQVKEVLQKKNLRYDKKGEEHYNIISALHKSMRDSDPDGALYWMARMLEGGEDPLYISRRLIRFTSEDIGMADPTALHQAVATWHACHYLGVPECNVNLAQCVVYLSMAPKSNALYEAYGKIQADIKKYGNLEVPLHIRNAPTKLMKEWGYGKDYQYAHHFENAEVDQQHLPDELAKKIYYEPTERGVEGRLREKLNEKRKKA